MGPLAAAGGLRFFSGYLRGGSLLRLAAQRQLSSAVRQLPDFAAQRPMLNGQFRGGDTRETVIMSTEKPALSAFEWVLPCVPRRS
jgi:hypothetical protein